LVFWGGGEIEALSFIARPDYQDELQIKFEVFVPKIKLKLYFCHEQND